MTDASRKPTPLEQDLARQDSGEIEFYIHKLAALTQIALKKIEAMVAEMDGNDIARRAGLKPVAKPALTFEQATDEFVRLSRSIRLCIKLSAKMEDELRARKIKAAADGTPVVKTLDPKVEARIKEAIAQLSDPHNPPTLH